MIKKHGWAARELIFAAIIAFAASFYFGHAFTNHDSVIYKIIADGIIEHGQMPYSYAFDHKPAFLYYIYAAFSLLYPFKIGFFAAISLLFYVVSAAIVSFYCYRSFRNVAGIALAIIFFSFPFVDFSGNTEILYSPLALASLLILMRSDSAKPVALSGMLAIFAVNTNYMVGVALSLPTVFLLISRDINSTVRRTAIYAAGVAIGLIVVFAPLQITVGVMDGYLKPQIAFLSAYGDGGISHTETLLFFLPVIASVLLCPALYLIDKFSSIKSRRELIAAALCMVSCIMCVIIAGKPFMHYSAIFFIPCCLFAVAAGKNAMAIIALSALPFNIYYKDMTIKLFNLHERLEASYTSKKEDDFKSLHALVGDEKVLSVRASHVLYYLSDMQPFDKYIWMTHRTQIMGDGEESYIMDKIRENPRFVMTGNNLCQNPAGMKDVCAYLKENYTLKKSVVWGFQFGGDVFERK